MKNNSSNVFIVIAGFFIVFVFGVVLKNNLDPNYESNSYYVKTEEMANAKIETISLNDDKLFINTSGDASSVCIKTTKSKPDLNNICWKNVENGGVEVSVYKNKTYYIWVKDSKGLLSQPKSINTK